MRDEKSVWRLAAAVGLIAVVLLCAITLIVLSIELNRIRPRIEAALTSALGREVVIEGEVSVGLALAPEVVARGIRIGNPDWASRDYLAYTERAVIQFELLPLLRDGLFIVYNLEFEGADIRLEQRDDGSNNWTIPRNL
ncbi:MAG: AsmA family protein, partial [Gemmatimonadales bacterium]